MAADLSLLSLEILLTFTSVKFDKHKHEKKERFHDHGKPHAKYHHHDNRTRKHHKALDHGGEAIVHGLLDRIHIVSKAAHQLTVGMGIIIPKRQFLDVGKEMGPDLLYHLLRGFYLINWL